MKALTPEQRAKAVEAFRAAVESGAHFRRDFADAEGWVFLASKRGIRLPAWWIAATPASLRRWLRKLRPGALFGDVYGFKQSGRITPRDLIERNPDWPLRAHVGCMLELAEVSK